MCHDDVIAVLFDVGKKELFNFANGFKTLQRKLKLSWKLAKHVVAHPCRPTSHAPCSIKDEITLDKLAPARIVVFAGPRDKFTSAEVHAMIY